MKLAIVCLVGFLLGTLAGAGAVIFNASTLVGEVQALEAACAACAREVKACP